MAGRAMQQSYPDPKTVAAASKLARTFSMQMDTLGQMRGRTGRQTIIVRKYEEHRHVHFDGDPGGRILEPEPMHQSEDGLQKTPRPSLTASRLANMAAAPRCQAKTRAGGSCRSAVVRGKARCRMHGGAKGSGGQRGKRNGVYKDGAWTNEAKAHTKQAQALIKRVRRLLMSYGIETTDSPTSS
jgi:glucans biosynthesis protein